MSARAALMAVGAGSFDLTGSGILTVGAGSTITDDAYYNSWASVGKRANGDLVTFYTKGVQHAGNNNSQPDFKSSTNGGSSWGSEGFIADDPSLKVASAGVTVTSSGREFVTLWRDDEGVSGTGEAGVIYSDDHWVTDSGWIALPNGFTGEAFGAGPVVEDPISHDLLVTIEGSASGDPALNRSCHTLRSTDGGATWGFETTVRNYATDTRPYYESCLLFLDTGELIVVHRTSSGSGTHYIQRSTDRGATWGAPYSAFAGFGQPHTIQGANRTLIAVTRRNSDSAAIAYTSIDRGLTWGSAVVLDATMNEMEYGCPVELGLGSYLVVYGSQPSGSTSNADIKQVYVTES